MKVGKTFRNKNKSIIYCCNISYLIISLSYRKVKFCPVSLVTGSMKFTSIKPLLTKMYRINQAVLWSTCLFISKHNTSSISSVQSLSRVRLFETLWIAARQASLSITNSRSSPKLLSIKSMMPSSHLILCRPLLLLPPIPPSIRVFSNESTLCMRWPKY